MTPLTEHAAVREAREEILSLREYDGELEYANAPKIDRIIADAVTKVCEPLRKALTEAVELIEYYHGEAGWEIYRDKSPEMKRIREAINPTNHERR
jgi:hypothetical protein